MSSSTGVLFRVHTFGESHGGGVGVVVDGCPPGLPLTIEDIQRELDRRRPGQSALTSPRAEEDRAEILSGLQDGRTLGTPIAILVRNRDANPAEYDALREVYRPSHADFTYDAKYGIRAASGGGRASARETIGRVAAGAIAQKLLARHGVEIVAWVARVGAVASAVDGGTVTRIAVDANAVRCPDADAAREMAALIERTRDDGDSLGGLIECVARGLPAGLGEPVFDKLDADLAKAMLSIPASKSFEIGSGLDGTFLRGSEHNDSFVRKDGRIGTATNQSGGIQGGISNGELIRVRVGFKPVSTIRKEQQTVHASGEERTMQAAGRHDPCVLPRAVPIVEAMMALTLADHLLRHAAMQSMKSETP